MSASWKNATDRGSQGAIRRAWGRLKAARPRDRLDSALAMLAAVSLAALVALAAFVALAIDRAGYFDPPVLRPMPDLRALENFRDSSAPIIGAAVMGDGAGDIVVLRSDGELTRIDPVAGLMDTETLPDAETGLETPARIIAAGCGLAEPGPSRCPEADTLSVVSEGGGILRQTAGARWRVVLHDNAWTGLQGTPVEQSEITSWAASESGRWVAVLAGEQGGAVFDTAGGRWHVPPDQSALVRAATEGGVRLVADAEGFWLIGARGLGRLTLRGNDVSLTWSPRTDFTVRDLTISEDRMRIAVVEGACDAGAGPDCLRLAQLRDPFELRTLIGETERFSSLSAAGLAHAQMQGDDIVTIGAAGVHAYDTNRRNWRKLLDGRADAFFVAEDGRILVTQGNIVAEIRNGTVVNQHETQGGPFTRVAYAGARALGLGADGSLRDLLTDVTLLGASTEVPDTAQFSSGASLDNRVLLAGSQGILLHNVETRQYQWFDPSDLGEAPLLRRSGVRIFGVQGNFWAVAEDIGAVARIVIAGQAPTQSLRTEVLGQLAGPVQSVVAGDAGLYLVDATGQPWLAQVSGLQPDIGRPRAQGTGLPTLAAEFGSGMVFANQSRLWFYDQPARDWIGPVPPPANQGFAALAANETLFAMTSTGQVFGYSGQGWAPALTGGSASVGLAAVTDAAQSGDTVFIGGQGRLQRYSASRASFSTPWTGGSGAVRIVSTENASPVWLSSGILNQGSQRLTDRSVRGAWRVSDGLLAEIRRGDGQNYTMMFPAIGGEPRCTRFTAPAPAGDVVDAVSLSNGQVLVGTSRGMAIHDASARRWIALDGPGLEPGERLQLAGRYLVIAGSAGLRAAPVSALPSLASCDTPRARLRMESSLAARAVAYDPGQGRFAVLNLDGSAAIWRDGRLQRTLPAANAGPRTADILTIAAAGTNLLAATPSALWIYDTRSRQWRQRPFRFLSTAGAVVDIGLRDVTMAGAAVTVWDADGRSFGGGLDRSRNDIVLRRMSVPGFPRISVPAAAIVDVAARNGTLAVMTPQQAEFGSGDANRLSGRLSLPDGLEPVISAWGSATLFQEPGDGLRHIIPPGTDLSRINGALSGAAFTYRPGSDRLSGVQSDGQVLWRVSEAGEILRCDIVAGGAAQSGCTQALPAPMQVNTDDVLAAAQAVGGYYVAVPSGLYALDRNYRNPRRVAGPQPGADSRFLSNDGLLFLDQPGGALWRLSDATAERITAQARDVRAFSNVLIVDAPDVALIPAANAELNGLATRSAFVSFDWVGSGGFTFLDGQGRVVGSTGRPVMPLAIPAPETATGALRDARTQGAWIQRGNGTLDLLVEGACDAGPHIGAQTACLVSALSWPLSDRGFGRLLGVSAQGGETVLAFERGVLTLGRDGDVTEDATPPQRFRNAPGVDASSLIESQIERFPGGVSELAPPRRGSNAISAADWRSGALAPQPTPWAPLDQGWLQWDRAQQEFVVRQSDGRPRQLSAGQMFRDGRLISTFPGRGSRGAASDPGFSWLTPHALWALGDSGAAPSLVALLDAPQVVGLNGDRFLFDDNQSLDAATGFLRSDDDVQRVSFGALEISEQLRSGSVSARLMRTDGQAVDAFAATGFLHDRRQGAGWRGQELVLATPAGILPASGFDAIDPIPAQGVPQRLVTVAGTVFSERAGQWHRLSARGQWATAQDPFAQREMAVEDGVIWRLGTTGFELVPQDPDESWRVARQGLSLDLDAFVSVAGNTDTVVLGTRLGTHVFDGGQRLDLGRPAADASPARAPFDAVSAVGQVPVIRDGAASPLIWDNGWRAPSGALEMPWQFRRAVETADIRIEFSAGAAPEAFRRVTSPGASRRWAQFGWTSGSPMPFDRARSIFATRTNLWIGTDFGLRRFSGRGATNSTVFDVAAQTGTAEAPPVTAVGLPQEDPFQALATTDTGDCALLDGASVSGPCTTVSSLERRYIRADSLWTWGVNNGRLSGQYRVDGAATEPVTLSRSGYWRHDTLASWVQCDGRDLELWQDGEVVRSAGQSRRLPRQSRDAGFLCQSTSAQLGDGGVLRPGSYLGGSTVFAVDASGTATTVQDPQLSQAVQERAGGGLAFEGQRLRITTGPFAGSYQYRTRSDQWRPIAFERGLPGIDRTLDFRASPARIHRLTAAGVIEQSLARARISLNPDTVSLRVAGSFDGWSDCDPRLMRRMDGQEHGIPAADASPLIIRCEDGVTLAERSPQQDLGAFEALEQDPFETVTLIDRGPWEWRRLETTSPFTLDIRFLDEPTALSAGRFPMDEFRSAATAFRGTLDLATANGWWRHPLTTLGSDGAERGTGVPDAGAVRDVITARDAQGARALCLDLPSAPLMLDADDTARAIDACLRWQGNDGFWTYQEGPAGPVSASALALNGPLLQRQVSRGRFTDLVALGAPRPLGSDLAVPTAQGVLVIGPDSRARGIYSFDRLLGLVPSRDDALSPMALTPAGLGSLLDDDALQTSDACGSESLSTDAFATGPIRTIERTAERLRFVATEATGETRAVTIACQAPGLLPVGRSIDVTSRTRHVAQMQGQSEATSRIELWATPDSGLMLTDGRRRQVDPGEAGAGPILAVYGATGARTMIAVLEADVLELDVDAAITLLAAQELGPDPQAVAERPAPAAQDAPEGPSSFAPNASPRPRARPGGTPEPTDRPGARPGPATNAPSSMQAPAPERTPEQASTPRAIPSPTPAAPAVFSANLSELTDIQRRTVQYALQLRNLYRMGIDGIVGPGTRAAIVAFQQSIGALPSGQLTADQLEMLLKEGRFWQSR